MWPSRSKTRFESLVRAYASDLYRFAYWLARDRAIAEDLVQECYARAWKNLDQLEQDGAAKSWLFSIVRNEHARMYAKQRPEQDAIALDDLAELADSVTSPALRLDLESALKQLPESYREPLLLQVIGGFSCAEIGAILSLNESNVMQRVSRARRALRGLLEPELCEQEISR